MSKSTNTIVYFYWKTVICIYACGKCRAQFMLPNSSRRLFINMYIYDGKVSHMNRCYILIFPPTHFSGDTSFYPGKISIYSFFPPERSVYTHLSPWFLGGKSEYILKFPPHTQFSPFALIDYTRAITPIRGRPYGDFCRTFDAEEGRSPLFFSMCNTFWNISQWLQYDPYVLFLAMAATFFHRRIYDSQTIVYTP